MPSNEELEKVFGKSSKRALLERGRNLTIRVEEHQGPLRAMYNNAGLKVATDSSGVVFWNQSLIPEGINCTATNDLSGCTVGIISSHFATILVHVWERRVDNNLWFTVPNGPAQQAKDAKFQQSAEELTDKILKVMVNTRNVAEVPSTENH
ncbi:hypothetical protein K469DRAFT_187887 [Zopfia rhizophila CBS 207.26]|uniref:Uncharacterized protein n=1 Tax=Zopfia rhizophila CBS 207.26 TaxID=1314779 RepID=A0A6A6ET77_9PEZI|nr:hypothetical protein K469DRAFT_187887 [Zopfia rhizophila CBS 207.26]